MSEEHDLEITRQVMSDPVKIEAEVTLAEAWLLLSAIQFSTRVPNMSTEMLEAMTRVGRKWQRKIAKLHPEAEQILEAGWYASRDR